MALRIGFIGAGGIARAHLKNVSAMEDVTIAAVSDVDRERAAQVAEQHGASQYTDWARMLEAEALDALYICLPPDAHGNLELDVARRAIPFYIEKPIHLSLATALAVQEAVKEENLVTSVGYQLRYCGAVQKACKFLADRRLSLVHGWYVGGLPGVHWWRRKAMSGGQAVEQATHIFDLALLLAGPVETVRALGTTGAMSDIEGYDVEDASVSLLEFQSGAVGYVATGCVLKDGGSPCVGLRLDGRDCTVEVSGNTVTITGPDRQPAEENFQNKEADPMSQADATFVEAVRSQNPDRILSDYASGVQTLAVTLAVNESMSRRAAVNPSELIESART